MDDAEHEACGDARVDRVAAGREDPGGRLGGQRVAGGHHPPAANDLVHRARYRRRRALGLSGVQTHARMVPWAIMSGILAIRLATP